MSDEAPVPLAEQPTREPGCYWVLVGDKWRPAEWTPSRFLEGGYWYVAGYGAGGRGLLGGELAEIGPRIPEVATLQQHERAMAALRDIQSDLHMLRDAINSVDSYRELLLRVGYMERVISMYVKK